MLKNYCLKDQIDQIIPYFKEKTVQKDSRVFVEGENFDFVFIIFEGEVLLQKRSK